MKWCYGLVSGLELFNPVRLICFRHRGHLPFATCVFVGITRKMGNHQKDCGNGPTRSFTSPECGSHAYKEKMYFVWCKRAAKYFVLFKRGFCEDYWGSLFEIHFLLFLPWSGEAGWVQREIQTLRSVRFSCRKSIHNAWQGNAGLPFLTCVTVAALENKCRHRATAIFCLSFAISYRSWELTI